MAESVTAVIVNFNGGDLVLEAIESLQASNYARLSIIVVDNASSDGSIETIQDLHPEVEVICSSRNLGFARGCNIGWKSALQSGAEFVLFINNDATVAPDAVGKLTDFLLGHPQAAAVAPFIFYHRDPQLIWFGGGSVSLWTGWIGHKRIRKRFDASCVKPEQTDYLTGCIFLARISALVETNGFDEWYDLYSEDVDLCLQWRKLGWELWILPESHGWHRISAAAGGELSPFKAYHRARSLVMLLKRHGGLARFVSLPLFGVLGGAAITLRLLLMGRFAFAVAALRGAFSGLLGLRVAERFKLKDQ